MGDNGRQTDVELVCHLFINIALNDEPHDLYLAARQNLALSFCLHLGRQVATIAVSVLLQLEQRVEQLLFCLVDIEAVEVSQLCGLLLRGGEHDGLAASLHEEGTLAQHNLYRYEKVEILFGLVGCQFSKGTQRVYLNHRHHALQQLSESYQYQRVATHHDHFGLSHLMHFHFRLQMYEKKWKKQ